MAGERKDLPAWKIIDPTDGFSHAFSPAQGKVVSESLVSFIVKEKNLLLANTERRKIELSPKLVKSVQNHFIAFRTYCQEKNRKLKPRMKPNKVE